MQTEPNAKQQVVEKIKNSTNILVTVGSNPSVDALSAALSLTLMLNRLDKHATAVFSGEVPPAIGFLEPAKTFEHSVDSLRDFIIALDKEKADRLRYKVENDVVRIFITPYRTVLSEKDLKFSQGDFNVELIIALGVEKREDLDTAVTAHGRILHDATVVTINADGGTSTLGSVDWSDATASSLCEMLMSLSEALQSGLLDQQIATAVLTGIVAATDRFRNERTSPRVMTMAAQLMAAGANQQLIAAQLEEGHQIPAETTRDGATKMEEGTSQKLATQKKDAKPAKPDGSLEITHKEKADAAPVADKADEALKEAEAELAQSLEQAIPAAPTLSVSDLKDDLAAAAEEVDEAARVEDVTEPEVGGPQIIKQPRRSWQTEPADKPEFGGSLNATADVPEEPMEETQPILTHDQPGSGEDSAPTTETSTDTELLSQQIPGLSSEPDTATPESQPLVSTSDDALSFEATPLGTPGAAPTLAQIDEQTRGKAAEDARAAIDAALSALPFDPAGKPLENAGSTPVFDDINASEAPVVPQSPALEVPAPIADPGVEAQPTMPSMLPELPPLPDFSTLPPLPDEQPVGSTPEPPSFDQTPVADVPVVEQPPQIPPTEVPTDPGQFKIPGQP